MIEQGPGTELAKLIRKLGVIGCNKCGKHAQTMNLNGCEWCVKNEDLILSWLKESAKERKLPFIDMIARRFIRRAIRNARERGACGSKVQM